MHFQLGDRLIGPKNPAFIVAEIGINHNGDLELAKKEIDAAADAGADSVKFQSYRTEDFLSDKSLMYEYTSNGKKVKESQYEMFKRCELSSAEFFELKNYCEKNNILFHSTPTSVEGVEELAKWKVPVLKNGSDLLTHPRVVEAMGKSGIPTVLSTGMATFSEIEQAVQLFRKSGGRDLILLHCTSAYPTPPEHTNLRRIPKLFDNFKCLVGFSDHTEGSTSAVGAIALGACWIEKHFTLDKNLAGPDHSMSLDPKELKEFISDIRQIEARLGSEEIQPTQAEEKSRINFRLSCVAARDLPAGHKIAKEDIDFHRPATGLAPSEEIKLLNKELTKSLKKGDQVLGEHIR